MPWFYYSVKLQDEISVGKVYKCSFKQLHTNTPMYYIQEQLHLLCFAAFWPAHETNPHSVHHTPLKYKSQFADNILHHKDLQQQIHCKTWWCMV